MAEVTCDGGAVLCVSPVPVLARDGVPYEVTLRLELDGRPFGEVGERCGYFLASTAARLRAARASGALPHSSLEAGLRAWAVDEGRDPDTAWEQLERYLPRDRDLFSFRSRDPDDPLAEGELRVSLRHRRQWADGAWASQEVAVLDAWGDGGRGVRAVLGHAELLRFLETLVREFAEVGARYDGDEDAAGVRRPVG